MLRTGSFSLLNFTFALPIETIFMPNSSAQFNASDEQIRSALQQAHIPVLLNTLVHLTHDLSLIEGDIQPSPSLMGGDPNASISEEQKEQIRELAFEALVRYRDSQQDLFMPNRQEVLKMATFLTRTELSDEYAEFALAELAIDGSETFPTENFDLIPESQRSNFKVLIVGAGMSGLLAGIRCKEAGIPFVIIEKNDEVGGTWYENQYPGCRVDSPNHVYSYSFKPHDWPQHFSDRHTLLAYFQEVANEFKLRESIEFNTEVKSMHFHSDTNTWAVKVESERGSATIDANAVITAVGQLNRSRMPDIPGIEDYKGPWFHSSRWNHNIDLKGKKVGIIGTGASAFQFTPEVVKQAKDVNIFLRTPPWVAINPQYHEYISDEVHWLLNNVPFYSQWFRFNMFWTSGEGLLSMARCDEKWNESETVSEANHGLRTMLCAAIEAQFQDRPDLVEKLTPTYPPAAKRMLIDNGHWYQSLKSDNVEVISEEIEQITESGLRTSEGTEHDFDVIIYGTGFQAVKFLYPMEIYGKDGRELREIWGEDPRAFQGITLPNYPNFFTLYGPNTNIVVNGSIIFFSECEMLYVMNCLHYLLKNNQKALECKPDPFKMYNEKIDHDNKGMAWGASNVNAWYKNSSGRVTQNWPGTLVEFWQQSKQMDPEDYFFS